MPDCSDLCIAPTTLLCKSKARICLHNWCKKKKNKTHSNTQESLVASDSSEKSKFIPDHSYRRCVSGIAIRKIYNFIENYFPGSTVCICSPQKRLHIVLHFNIRIQAIRQGQLSGVVKFKKIYGVDGDAQYVLLLPKDVREEVICVPALLPPQLDGICDAMGEILFWEPWW